MIYCISWIILFVNTSHASLTVEEAYRRLMPHQFVELSQSTKRQVESLGNSERTKIGHARASDIALNAMLNIVESAPELKMPEIEPTGHIILDTWNLKAKNMEKHLGPVQTWPRSYHSQMLSSKRHFHKDWYELKIDILNELRTSSMFQIENSIRLHPILVQVLVEIYARTAFLIELGDTREVQLILDSRRQNNYQEACQSRNTEPASVCYSNSHMENLAVVERSRVFMNLDRILGKIEPVNCLSWGILAPYTDRIVQAKLSYDDEIFNGSEYLGLFYDNVVSHYKSTCNWVERSRDLRSFGIKVGRKSDGPRLRWFNTEQLLMGALRYYWGPIQDK